MGSTAYVGQGFIKVLVENIEEMRVHLESLGKEFVGEDIEDTCGHFGISVSFENDGSISDAYPDTSKWSDDYEGKFYQEIASFVEDGSYQTFYCDGYLFAYIYRKGDVTEVSLDDVAKAIACELMGTCSTCAKSVPESKLPYQWPDPKVMEAVSPGDTVPLGLCPYCKTGVVYQNEEE